MSDNELFRKYIDIINEGPEQVQNVQRSRDAAKWAQENPGSAQALKIGADVVTDFIPGVSQVKSAYRAGKAAMSGDYGEAGRQLVGTFVPGGRRMVGAVDAGIDAAKGDYKGALTNLSYAAGGDIAKVASAANLGSTVANLTGVGGNNQPAAPTTQTAPTQIAQAQVDQSALDAPSQGPNWTPSNALKAITKPEPTTEEIDEVADDELNEILRLSGQQKVKSNESIKTGTKKFLNIINESDEKSIDEKLELHDSFDIELNENFVIETGIIGFTTDGVIIEADETLLGLLEVNDILCEDETYDQEEEEVAEDDQESISGTLVGGQADGPVTVNRKKIEPNNPSYQKYIDRLQGLSPKMNFKNSDGSPLNPEQREQLRKTARDIRNQMSDGELNEAEYQGRKVQLGKPMAGDVKKSKVYVRKPNGKIVKVNFGDKKMKIKKSNPKRRKSFRARHRCENPGPRWKARYWSCRAW